MKPSTFVISDHIEAIRMFTTFFQYENHMSDSWLQNAMPAAQGCKWIAKNFADVHPSMTENEVDELIKMIDQVANRMEQYKNDLLKDFGGEDDEWE
jgi:hypothetical protein|tara:strand:- start:218 stop:505 length:288 start_codon:yes stop_codon:yes gene_type:complete